MDNEGGKQRTSMDTIRMSSKHGEKLMYVSESLVYRI